MDRKPFTGSLSDASQLETFNDLSDSRVLSNFDDERCAVSADNTLDRKGLISRPSTFELPKSVAPGIYAL